MSMRSALAGAATTTIVVAALGNPAVVDAAGEEGSLLSLSVTGFANWDVGDQPGEVVGLVALRLGLTIVLAALLCGLAGRSRSRPAAWIGGWGAVVVASAVAGAAGYVYQVAVVLDGRTFAATYADGLVQSANGGATFGLWTGWLVGLAVALATRPVRAPARLGAEAWAPAPTGAGPAVLAGGTVAGGAIAGGHGAAGASPTGRRIADPPPPWWAPTTASSDAGVQPGPTAFPPGGFGPVVAGAGEPVPPLPARPGGATHEMSTSSGDPHPSDPDGTPAMSSPPPAADPTRAAGPPGPVPADPDADPDATAVERRPDDHTAEIPRPDG